MRTVTTMTNQDMKPCAHCGKVMHKGKLRPRDWLRRTFCSFACSTQAQKARYRYGKNDVARASLPRTQNRGSQGDW